MMIRHYLRLSESDKRRPVELTGYAFISSIIVLVAVLIISDLTKVSSSVSTPLIGTLAFVILGLGIVFIFTSIFKEKVAKLQIPAMTGQARRLAFEIKRQMKPVWLVKLLNIERSPWGYPLPNIGVYVESDCSTGWVAIENSPLFNSFDSEQALSDLSGLMSTRRLRRLGFTSSEISRDGTYYIFYFEDVQTSQRLQVVNGDLTPFVSDNPHELLLAKNLIWHVSGSTPHLAIIGHTRSGKSYFVAHFLLPLMLLQGWKVAFYSVKNDRYVQKFKGEYEPLKIIEALESWEKTMRMRNAKIRLAGKDKYTDMQSMPDIAIVIDEIASLNGAVASDRKLKQRWETVIGKLTATGASAGIHVIALSQYGTKESFLPTTARANVSDAVILLGMAADSPSDRQYLLPGFDISHREYQTGQGVARIVSAGNMWEKPHFYETPLFKN
jgi:hypothetical protein